MSYEILITCGLLFHEYSVKIFSRLACPMCLVSYPGNESCVHCDWWPWGVPILSNPASENKHSLARVKYTGPIISVKCV